MAIIAVELEKTDNAELTLFLVEEPEAHLHPQLQAAVLNFLEERAIQSLKPKNDPNAPAGNLQVVVATHSPNLSAWVPNRNLVFVRSIISETENTESEETLENAKDQSVLDLEDSAEVPNDTEAQVKSLEPAQTPRPESRCIPLSKLDLSDEERRKIDRYLDVTKSALLFGGRVFLVEGIAEALLLPAIARHHVLKVRPAEFRIFRSAVFVPIDGVDFQPYAKALLLPYNGVRIAERLVIVTDGDAQSITEGTFLPGQSRKDKLEKLARDKSASDNLDVCINTYSLETELVNAGNAAVMKDVYLGLHPRSEEKWDTAVALAGHDKAKALQKIFKDTPKGDFAQLLAEKVSNSADFQVPPYLVDAIEAIVK